MTMHVTSEGTIPYTTKEIKQVIDVLTKPENSRGLGRRGVTFGDDNKITKAIRLNQSQMRALFASIEQPLSLIQGPPGLARLRLLALL